MDFMTYLLTDFIYPYGNDWDKFIHQSIQQWEDFYIQWILNEKNIFVIYPDSLVDDLRNTTLKNLANFMSFKLNELRLNCVLKQIEDTFPRKKENPETDHLDMTPKKLITSLRNSCVSNQICALDIYSKKHLIWINSSIRNVKK